MKNPVATITLGSGETLVLELYPHIAPNTVNNFMQLANSGRYDGLTFHRIVREFMIQGGSFTGDCKQKSTFTIRGEFTENGHENSLAHVTGVISMARGAAFDSASTQFFIMHRPAPRLDGKYAAFGKLTAGYELLERLGNTPTDETPGRDNPPLTPVVTATIRVDPGDWAYREPARLIPPVE